MTWIESSSEGFKASPCDVKVPAAALNNAFMKERARDAFSDDGRIARIPSGCVRTYLGHFLSK
jgi:hypothetical protein